MQISLEIRGDRAVLEALARTPAALAIGLRRAAAHVESVVKRKLSGEALRVRTGRLRSSIVHRVRGSYPVLEAVVGTNVVYARIHEYGGTIVPRRAKVLRFEVGGQTVFARRVRIPRRPFMEPAARESATRAAQIVLETLTSALGSR